MPDKRVDFLAEIHVPVFITNNSCTQLRIESISLFFKPIVGADGADVIVKHSYDDFSIDLNRQGYRYVRVVPSLLFRPYTNDFEMKISYRRKKGPSWSRLLTKRYQQLDFYLIINPAPPGFGNIFISYKHEEDLALADLVRELARNAGFVPYTAPTDIKPGTRIWNEKIPQHIRSSKATFVIWTTNTALGPGVQKEIKISRKIGVPDVLLLEDGIPVPSLYKAKFADYEHVRFHRSSAAVMFATALQKYRE